MSKHLKYVPVFRVRQQENLVLESFDFGKRIFPCIEIVKELDRIQPTPKPGSKKKEKTFEDFYLPFVEKINAEKVFIDLPVHLAPKSNMKPEVLKFLRGIISNIDKRTEYMRKFIPLKTKIIPVVSSYFNITGKSGTIEKQVKELRKDFDSIAIRTFPERFKSDYPQMKTLLSKKDYLIVDWEYSDLDELDEEQKEIIELIETLNCTIIIHRCAIPKELKNVDLNHGKIVTEGNNYILDKYHLFSGTCFSDYCGIKKDDITKGGSVSPGFIYYDAVNNVYYGYKGVYQKPETYETIIIPDVLSSSATKRMRTTIPTFLSTKNIGWGLINDISSSRIKGKYASIYKRISMEHYLHCIQQRITNGDFD